MPTPTSRDIRSARAALTAWYGDEAMPGDSVSVEEITAILKALDEPTDTEAVISWLGPEWGSPTAAMVESMGRARAAAAAVR